MVSEIFVADYLSWRFFENVLKGNSLHKSFNHGGKSREVLVLLSEICGASMEIQDHLSKSQSVLVCDVFLSLIFYN